MYIQEFLEILKTLPENIIIENVNLADYGSDRGDYEDFYLGTSSSVCSTTIRDCIDLLETKVIGKTFRGYKGGDFVMDEITSIRLGLHGISGDPIDGITFKHDGVKPYCMVKVLKTLEY